MSSSDASARQQPAHDEVNHPAHYTAHPSGVECITIVRHYDYDIGNVIKYCWRAGLKGEDPTASELIDLQKAAWYLNDRIEMLKKKAQPSS